MNLSIDHQQNNYYQQNNNNLKDNDQVFLLPSTNHHQQSLDQEEDFEIRDWLDLDQADEEIGIPSTIINKQTDYQQDLNLNRLDFDSSSFDSNLQFDQSTTTNNNYHHHHQSDSVLDSLLIDHHDHQLKAISLDPSTILSTYNDPSHSHHLTTHNNNNNHHQSTTPTYALDPLLISASIPNTHHHITKDLDKINHNTNVDSNSIPPSNLKITLSTKSHQLASKKETIDPIQSPTSTHRSSHSRSSSAAPLGQPTTPSSSNHKRTLSHLHPLVNLPDWDDKPSAEEYKKLSSKEKRQLRNKISARNFRHRRKQHISALEQQVAQRDRAIESLYNDLGAVQMENKELKSQVESLKQKWADLMKKIEEMSLGSTINNPTTTATGTTVASSPSTSNVHIPVSPRLRSTKASNNLIPLPSLHKDLGSHTRKPFNGTGGMAGGNVGVHTTLIPEIPVDVYEGILWPRLKMNTSSQELSPQALIEMKLKTDDNDDEDRPSAMSSSESAKATMIRKSCVPELSIDQPIMLKTTNEEHEQLSNKLKAMLIDAFKVGGPDAEERIDLEKVKGCLEGRLVIKLVEPSPPPYLDDHPASASSPLSIELLSRKFTELELATM